MLQSIIQIQIDFFIQTQSNALILLNMKLVLIAIQFTMAEAILGHNIT
jgi:hypothetical protein